MAITLTIKNSYGITLDELLQCLPESSSARRELNELRSTRQATRSDGDDLKPPKTESEAYLMLKMVYKFLETRPVNNEWKPIDRFCKKAGYMADLWASIGREVFDRETLGVIDCEYDEVRLTDCLFTTNGEWEMMSEIDGVFDYFPLTKIYRDINVTHFMDLPTAPTHNG